MRKSRSLGIAILAAGCAAVFVFSSCQLSGSGGGDSGGSGTSSNETTETGGGGSGGGGSASAPSSDSGTFTSVGSLNTPRFDFAAALLPDGKVLIAGGESQFANLNTAEIYDPVNQTFSDVPNTMVNTYARIAITLDTGKVLLTKEIDSNGSALVAELYDPATQQFTATGAPPFVPLSALKLSDGRVLVANRIYCDSSGNSSTQFSIYDPAAGTFSSVTTLSSGGIAPTLSLLPGGKVLVGTGYCHFDPVFGGYGGGIAEAYKIFDPADSSFTAAASGDSQIDALTGLPFLGDVGKALVAGRSSSDSNDYVEIYDPSANSFSSVALPDGTGLSLSGGTGSSPPAYGVLLSGGKVLFPGYQGSSSSLFDPASGTFTKVGGPLVSHGVTAGLVALQDGSALFVGGTGGFGGPAYGDAEVYHP